MYDRRDTENVEINDTENMHDRIRQRNPVRCIILQETQYMRMRYVWEQNTYIIFGYPSETERRGKKSEQYKYTGK